MLEGHVDKGVNGIGGSIGITLDLEPFGNEHGAKFLPTGFNGVNGTTIMLVGTVSRGKSGEFDALEPHIAHMLKQGNEVILQFKRILAPSRAPQKKRVVPCGQPCGLYRGRIKKMRYWSL